MSSNTNYYVYIVECSDGTYYTGQTDNLELRIKKHNGEFKGGAKYTRGKGPVFLKHFEEFSSRSEALKREAEIKKLNKKKKETIIQTGNKPL